MTQTSVQSLVLSWRFPFYWFSLLRFGWVRFSPESNSAFESHCSQCQFLGVAFFSTCNTTLLAILSEPNEPRMESRWSALVSECVLFWVNANLWFGLCKTRYTVKQYRACVPFIGAVGVNVWYLEVCRFSKGYVGCFADVFYIFFTNKSMCQSNCIVLQYPPPSATQQHFQPHLRFRIPETLKVFVSTLHLQPIVSPKATLP